MNQSKLVKHKFTKDLNEKEVNYRNIIQPQEDKFNDISKWIKTINDGRRNISPILYRLIEFKGEILELGAGSCWFSSELSLLKSVNKIYCLDISEFILKNVAPYVMEHLGANTEKLIRVIGDFNKLYFQDKKFDYVVFDASLHHIPEDSFIEILKEVYRVLKIDGKVVAIRESFLSPIPIFNKYRRRTFGLHEKKYGVTENIFTKREWENMFENAGFECHFIPYDLQVNNTLNLKNLMKKFIKYSPLRAPFSHFFPRYIIVLRKC